MLRSALLFALLGLASCTPAAPPPEAAAAQLEIPPLPPSSAPAPKSVVRDATAPEQAEVVARDPAKAEALFREAREALARGDLTTARDKLVESNRLDPATGTVLNLAEVESRLGDVANARRHFQEAYDRATAEGRQERAKFAKQRLDALPP